MDEIAEVIIVEKSKVVDNSASLGMAYSSILHHSADEKRLMIEIENIDSRISSSEFKLIINQLNWELSHTYRTVYLGRELVEVIANARAGHAISQQVLAELMIMVAKNLPNKDFSEQRRKEILSIYEEKLTQISKKVRQQRAEAKKIAESKKPLLRVLDKKEITPKEYSIIPENLKTTYTKLPNGNYKATLIDQLIKENRRSEAIAVVREYLPWELLTPVEKLNWQEVLFAKEHPVPLEQRILLFRGKADNRNYQDAFGTKFDMAPRIERGQGTYNRRLRSIKTELSKNYFANLLEYSGMTKSQLIATRLNMYYSLHAGTAKASMKSSFTSKLSIARNFGKGPNGNLTVMTALLDPAALNQNFRGLGGEKEFLSHLFTFPEDTLKSDAFFQTKDQEKSKEILKQAFVEKAISMHGLNQRDAEKAFDKLLEANRLHNSDSMDPSVKYFDQFIKQRIRGFSYGPCRKLFAK